MNSLSFQSFLVSWVVAASLITSAPGVADEDTVTVPADVEVVEMPPAPEVPEDPLGEDQGASESGDIDETPENAGELVGNSDLPLVMAPDLLDPELLSIMPTDDALILLLEEAQEQALLDNPNLQAAAQRIKQAEQRVEQAQSLYYPRLDADFSAAHTELPESTVQASRDAAVGSIYSGLQRTATSLLFGGGQGGTASTLFGVGQTIYGGLAARNAIDDDISTFNGSLVASYLVFDGFSRKATNAIAEYGQLETEAAYQEARRLLLAAVAQAFFGVQLARENVAIAYADENFNRRLLREAQARRRVGTGSLSDVLNFEVQIRAARSQLLNAQNDYQQSRIALAALMGLPEAKLGDEVVVAELLVENADEMTFPEEGALIAYALENHPNIRRSDFTVRRTDASVRQQKSAYYPQVSALASKDATRNSNARFEEDDFSTTVGVNMQYNLYAGGARKAAVAEAKYIREEADRLRRQTELDVASEVRQALENLRTAQQQLVLQRTTTEYVERNRDLVEREYEAGQGALARLNQAQRDLIEAQARLAVAQVSLRLAWHDVRVATSGILNEYQAIDPALEVVEEE